MNSNNLNTIIQKFNIGVQEYAPKLIITILSLWLGLKIIKFLSKMVNKAMDKNDLDPSLKLFLSSLIGITFKAALFISIAGMLGVQTTSFIAILGSAGLAVGLALQGSLANFAGGVMILLFKPFNVGDFIDAQGFQGSVRSITVFNTILSTGDNKKIIIPNGPLANGAITNVSAEKTRRVDFSFGIGYEDDIRVARNTINEILEKDSRTLKDPAIQIVVGELAESSVNLTVRVWVDAKDYWGVYFDTLEAVKMAFDNKGVSFPYPQTEIHLSKSVPLS